MHGGTVESFGAHYSVGDVIGCFIDVADQTISKRNQLSLCFLKKKLFLFIVIKKRKKKWI